jgi:hypothetical protein
MCMNVASPHASFKHGCAAASDANAAALRVPAAVFALAPDAVVLADAGTPAVVAPAPDAVVLADASAPAVLAPARGSPCTRPSDGYAG